MYSTPDPLNRHPLAYPADEKHPELVQVFGPTWTLSTALLPGAPQQPFAEVDPAVRKGKVEEHRFRSALLGNERRIWVYTPPDYNAAEDCGLLLMFDGTQYLRIHQATTVLDNLIAARQISPTVAVCVDALETFTVRKKELLFNETFVASVATEILPWLHTRYRFMSDPRRSVIGGASLGGLAAALVAFRHPELFGNVISQSGAFNYGVPGESDPEAFARLIDASPALPLRFSLDAGRFEGLLAGTTVNEDHNPGIVVANRHLDMLLRAKGYEVTYHEFAGAHDFVGWTITFPDHLRRLMAPVEGGRKING